MVAVAVSDCEFDRNAEQYKCCCKCCHVKTGTLIIGILGAIGVALQLAGIIYNVMYVGVTYHVIGNIVWVVIGTVVLTLLFAGIHKESGPYLIPHLILQMLGIIVTILGLTVFIFVLVTGGAVFSTWLGGMDSVATTNTTTIDIPGTNVTFDLSNVDFEEISKAGTWVLVGVGVTGSLIFLIYLIISIWLFVVVVKCYRFFRDSANQEGTSLMEEEKQDYGTTKASNQAPEEDDEDASAEDEEEKPAIDSKPKPKPTKKSQKVAPKDRQDNPGWVH